jgi:hypothetical protein
MFESLPRIIEVYVEVPGLQGTVRKHTDAVQAKERIDPSLLFGYGPVIREV